MVLEGISHQAGLLHLRLVQRSTAISHEATLTVVGAKARNSWTAVSTPVKKLRQHGFFVLLRLVVEVAVEHVCQSLVLVFEVLDDFLEVLDLL